MIYFVRSMMFRISTKEFVQYYIHGYQSGMNHEEIAKKIGISISLYNKKLHVANLVTYNRLGIYLPKLPCDKSIQELMEFSDGSN